MQSWRRGLSIGAALLAVISGVADLWVVGKGERLPWFFWLCIGFVALIALIFPVVAIVQRIMRKIRHLQSLTENGAKYEELQYAAAEWQERAQRAESKLNDWDSKSMSRGRSRVLGEMFAAAAHTSFGQVGVALLSSDEVALAAKITGGTPPALQSIFFIEGNIMHDVKAAIRCVGYLDPDTVDMTGRVEMFVT